MAALTAMAEEIETLVEVADVALIEAKGFPDRVNLEPLRNALRAWPCEAIPIAPAMPVRVWLALTDHAMSERLPVRQHPAPGLRLAPLAFDDLARGKPCPD